MFIFRFIFPINHLFVFLLLFDLRASLHAGIYLTVTMAMTSLSIMLTVFVLQLHHAGPHQKAVPAWMRSLVIGAIARVLCMRSHLPSYYGHAQDPEVEDIEVSTTMMTEQAYRFGSTDAEFDAEQCRRGFRSNGRLVAAGGTAELSMSLSASVDALQSMNTAGVDVEERRLKSCMDCYRWGGGLSARRALRQRGGVVPRQMKICVTKYDKRKEYEEIVNEWRLVAHIVDRLLFWLFLVGSLLSTLTLLVFMPMTKPTLVDKIHII